MPTKRCGWSNIALKRMCFHSYSYLALAELKLTLGELGGVETSFFGLSSRGNAEGGELDREGEFTMAVLVMLPSSMSTVR